MICKETNDECPICFEEIGVKNNCITECGHRYCLKCILNSTQTKNFHCPLCRAVMVDKIKTKREPITQLVSRTLNDGNIIYDDLYFTVPYDYDSESDSGSETETESGSVSSSITGSIQLVMNDDGNELERVDYSNPIVKEYPDPSFLYYNPEFNNEVCIKTQEIVEKKIGEFTMKNLLAYTICTSVWWADKEITDEFVFVKQQINKVRHEAYYELKNEFNERKNMINEDVKV